MSYKASGLNTGSVGAQVSTSDPRDPYQLSIAGFTNGGTAVYDTTHVMHGTKALKVTNATSGDKSSIGWLGWSSTVLTNSFYIYFAAYPSAAMDLAVIRNASTWAGKLQIWADGKIRVVTQTGTVKTFGSAIGTGAFRRIEWSVDVGTTTTNGRIKCAYYSGDSTTATDSYDSGATTNCGAGSAINQVYIGFQTSSVTGEFWLDSIQAQDSSATLGPYPSTFALTFTFNDTSTCTDSGFTLSRDWRMVIDDTSSSTDELTVLGVDESAVPDEEKAKVGAARVGASVGWLYGLQEPSGALVAGDVSGVAGRPRLEMRSYGGSLEFGASGMPEGCAVTFSPEEGGETNVELYERWFKATYLYAKRVAAYVSTGSTFFAQFSWTGDSGVQLLHIGSTASGFLTILATPTSVFVRLGNSSGAVTTITRNVVTNDGEAHFVCLTVSGNTARLYVDHDGVAGVSTIPSGLGYLTGLSVGNMRSQDPLQMAWVGYMPVAITGARAADLGALATGQPEVSSARVARIVRWLGLTDSSTIETGMSSVAYQACAGGQPLDLINEVNRVEGGVFYVTGSGRLVQHSRAHRYNAPIRAVIDAACIEPGDLAVTVDLASLRNDVAASRQGGVSFRARDEASIQAYGEHSESVEVLAASDGDMEAVAQWLVARYGQPAPRLPSITIDLLTLDEATANQVLGLEIGDRIQITGMPSQTPGGTSIDLFIEGLPNEQMSHTAWSVTFATSPVLNVFVVAQVGSATVGSARVAY